VSRTKTKKMKQDIFRTYIKQVSKLFGIKESQLFIKNKSRGVVDARHLLYYVSYDRPMRIRYIQKYMEERGYQITHSSIIYGIKQVEEKMSYDADYRMVIKHIKECDIL